MNWKPWLHGLLAAFIGGGAAAGAAAISGMVVKPQAFNLGVELKSTLTLMAGTFLLSGIISVLLFLQKSPLPDDSPTTQAMQQMRADQITIAQETQKLVELQKDVIKGTDVPPR